MFLEEYDIYEQAYLINQAKLIVGPTGAAWTNLLYASYGAKGLCLMSDSIGDISIFPNIANRVGFELFYFFYSNESNKLQSSFYLDPKQFEVSLAKLLKI
jgi:capsular polysaccharide biosynthesis protein